MTRAWRRRARSSHTLPDGPGLAVRWAMAVPLMLVTAFGPVAVVAVYRAWSDLAFDELLESRQQSFLSFDDAFRENLPGTWPLALLPLGLTIGFLLRRNRMASWPTATLAERRGGARARRGRGPVHGGDDPVAPKAALLGAVLVACFLLGRAAEYVLSRPVATDIVRSRLEIAMRLPRQLPRLRIQENRLVLDRLRRQSEPAGVDPGRHPMARAHRRAVGDRVLADQVVAGAARAGDLGARRTRGSDRGRQANLAAAGPIRKSSRRQSSPESTCAVTDKSLATICSTPAIV